VSTIAHETGFSSISAFNTAFKASHGTTPSHYRAYPHIGEAETDPGTTAQGLTKAV